MNSHGRSDPNYSAMTPLSTAVRSIEVSVLPFDEGGCAFTAPKSNFQVEEPIMPVVPLETTTRSLNETHWQSCLSRKLYVGSGACSSESESVKVVV